MACCAAVSSPRVCNGVKLASAIWTRRSYSNMLWGCTSIKTTASRSAICMSLTMRQSSRHRAEIDRFQEAIEGDFHFLPLAYGEFVTRLREVTAPAHDSYFTYLALRYGFGVNLY